MGNLDRRHQMADVNNLESTVLKVCDSFLIEVVSEEGSVDQCDSFGFQRPEASRCRGRPVAGGRCLSHPTGRRRAGVREVMSFGSATSTALF
jgi:hypothetical protein